MVECVKDHPKAMAQNIHSLPLIHSMMANKWMNGIDGLKIG